MVHIHILLFISLGLPVFVVCDNIINNFLRNSTQGEHKLFFDLFDSSSSQTKPSTAQVKICNCTCGTANQEIRIVGGRPTGINRYPWLARLTYNGELHCGATLVSDLYLVTAAHCVRNLQRNKMRIVLGDYDQFSVTDTPSVTRRVAAVIRHKRFSQNTYNNDIALLKLSKPMKFNKRISPICLPKQGFDPAGRSGTVVGWGRQSENGQIAGEAQETRVPILSQAQCRDTKYRPSRILTTMLCAGGDGSADSCQGDSGGPLKIRTTTNRYVIVGVVSWGVGCARPGYPGVYTRVPSYVNWIATNSPGACYCTSSEKFLTKT